MNKLNLEGIHLDMDELIKKYNGKRHPDHLTGREIQEIHELEANKL